MEEQLEEENPEVLLTMITDLQKENAGLHEKIIKLEKETKVLQEFVLPCDEKIRVLSSYLKEWKDRYLLLNEEKMNLEIENKFKAKKIQSLLDRDQEKMIINLKKDKEKLSASSQKWYSKYKEKYSENFGFEREIETLQSVIKKQQSEITYLQNLGLEKEIEQQQSVIKRQRSEITYLKDKLAECGSVWIMFNSYSTFIYFLQGFFDGWIQHWSYVLWIVIILKTNLPSIKFDNT